MSTPHHHHNQQQSQPPKSVVNTADIAVEQYSDSSFDVNITPRKQQRKAQSEVNLFHNPYAQDFHLHQQEQLSMMSNHNEHKMMDPLPSSSPFTKPSQVIENIATVVATPTTNNGNKKTLLNKTPLVQPTTSTTHHKSPRRRSKQTTNPTHKEAANLPTTKPTSNFKRLMTILPPTVGGTVSNIAATNQSKQQQFSPITLPTSLPLSSLPLTTQQLAVFLIDHLQSQQQTLSQITTDLSSLRDIIKAGGLCLQKQSKDIIALRDVVLDHENSIDDLHNTIQRQEAELRAEIIYQQQQQYLKQVQFCQYQRQTRIDNFFDLIILAIALLCTGSGPVTFVNSTLSSLCVSTLHWSINNIAHRHPYTFKPINEDMVDVTGEFISSSHDQPPMKPAAIVSPIASSLPSTTFMPPINNMASPMWTAAPSATTPITTTSYTSTKPLQQRQQPYTPYYYTPQAKMRRWRKFLFSTLFRSVEIFYIFLFLRKFLMNIGLIQSPMTEYLRAFLPPWLYNNIISRTVRGSSQQQPNTVTQLISKYIPRYIPYFGEYFHNQKPPNEMKFSDVDDFHSLISSKPLSKQEILAKVLKHMATHPEYYTSTSMTAISGNDNALNETHCNSPPPPLQQLKSDNISESDKISSKTQKFFNATGISQYLPQWITTPCAALSDNIINSINPLSDPMYTQYLKEKDQIDAQTSANVLYNTSNPLDISPFDKDSLRVLCENASAPTEHEVESHHKLDNNASQDRLQSTKTNLENDSIEVNIPKDGRNEKNRPIYGFFRFFPNFKTMINEVFGD